jgi:PIN domain nuclease of toxin-antitoxin system
VNVFDSSAILALMNEEPGAERVAAALVDGDSHISAANYAEVMSKVYERGTSDEDAAAIWRALRIAVQPLTPELADAAARLRPSTRALGLSLGDRCCLALGQSLQATVVTGDRAWLKLRGFRFLAIR